MAEQDAATAARKDARAAERQRWTDWMDEKERS